MTDRIIQSESIRRAMRGSFYPPIRAQHPAALPAWVSVAIILTIIAIFVIGSLCCGGL